MRKIIGKAQYNNKSNFRQKFKIDNKVKIGDNDIANESNEYFTDIGPSLAKNILYLSMPFESFLKKVNTTS